MLLHRHGKGCSLPGARVPRCQAQTACACVLHALFAAAHAVAWHVNRPGTAACGLALFASVLRIASSLLGQWHARKLSERRTSTFADYWACDVQVVGQGDADLSDSRWSRHCCPRARQRSLQAHTNMSNSAVAARDPGNLGASSSLLFKFASQQDLSQWNVFSDKEHGGKSEAELRLADDEPVSCL